MALRKLLSTESEIRDIRVSQESTPRKYFLFTSDSQLQWRESLIQIVQGIINPLRSISQPVLTSSATSLDPATQRTPKAPQTPNFEVVLLTRSEEEGVGEYPALTVRVVGKQGLARTKRRDMAGSQGEDGGEERSGAMKTVRMMGKLC